MATVNITISDTDNGAMIRLQSDSELRAWYDNSADGTLAENLAIIALYYLKMEVKSVVGVELQVMHIQ